MIPLAQAAPALDPTTILAITLIFIFVTAIVTTIFTKWSRDKCLRYFHAYHVTIERQRGQTLWGRLKVFSTGTEVVYDHAYADHRGRKKTTSILYQQDMDGVLSLLRFHDELAPGERALRDRQVKRTFNPGPTRRLWRMVRNLVNTLRDAFASAIGAVVGQYQKLNPTNAVLATQAGSVTQIGQTLLGKFANAYEPLLEQYIGQPVILDVLDPLNPNNSTVEYTGYLADYTQQWIAVFNVAHREEEVIRLVLPDVEVGERLPPLPPPPPVGAPAPVLPPAMKEEACLQVRVNGARMKVLNAGSFPVVVRRLERAGFEAVELGVVLPARGTLDLPCRDARGGTLVAGVAKTVDVVAPRKWATVRHAGVLVERKGFMEELAIDELPLVPKFFGRPDRAEEQTQEGPAI